MFGHPAWLQGPAKFGWTGVDLFFVLSGFLIASQLFQQIKQKGSVPVRAFFIKRFFRILPAYWAIVALYYYLPYFHEREALPPLWKFLTFTQNFGLDIQNHGTFSHAWSLCVEEHFYLLLPLVLTGLLLSGLFRISWLLLPLIFIAGFGIRHYNWIHFYLPHIQEDNNWNYWYKYIYYPSYNRLDGLIAGVSIAALYVFSPNMWLRISRYGNLLILAGIISFVPVILLFTEQSSYGASVFCFPMVAMAYGLIVMGAISPGSFLYRWKSPFTTWLATLSYAVYLSHKGIIHITQIGLSAIGIHATGMAAMLCCISMCLTTAAFLNLMVEQPFLLMRKRFEN